MYKHKIITTQEFERRIKAQMAQERRDSELHRAILQRANTKAFCESDKRVNSLRRYKKNQIIQQQQNNIDEYNKSKQQQIQQKDKR